MQGNAIPESEDKEPETQAENLEGLALSPHNDNVNVSMVSYFTDNDFSSNILLFWDSGRS